MHTSLILLTQSYLLICLVQLILHYQPCHPTITSLVILHLPALSFYNYQPCHPIITSLVILNLPALSSYIYQPFYPCTLIDLSSYIYMYQSCHPTLTSLIVFSILQNHLSYRGHHLVCHGEQCPLNQLQSQRFLTLGEALGHMTTVMFFFILISCQNKNCQLSKGGNTPKNFYDFLIFSHLRYIVIIRVCSPLGSIDFLNFFPFDSIDYLSFPQ